jgi:hypothetical protein
VLLICLAIGVAVWMSWQKWGDLFVDTGRELEVPRRLLAGERLYADVAWYYGPLAPWLNALFYRVFGVNASVLAWAGIASAAVLALMVDRLARRFVGPWLSAACAIAFVELCAFKHLSNIAVFNFAMPYTYAATYGMVMAGASLLFLVRHTERRRTADLFLSVAFLALAAMAKLEVLLPVLAAHALFLLVALRQGSWPRGLLVAALGVALLVLATGFGLAAWSSGSAIWSGMGGLFNDRSRHFMAWSGGWADPAAALADVARSAGLLITSVALGWGSSRLCARHERWRWAVSCACAGLVGALYAWRGVELGFQATPVVLLVALIAVGWSAGRSGDLGMRLPELLVLAFSLAALARIPLRVKPDHYGFYLLPVGLVGLALVTVRLVPGWLRVPARDRLPFAAVAAGLLLGSGVGAQLKSAQHYAFYDLQLRTPRGGLVVQSVDAPLVQLIADLRRLPPETRLVALPQGSAVGFFAGLESGQPWSSYLPMEVPTAADDARLTSSMAARPPDLILRVLLDTSEFGSRGFGEDYALASSRWIDSNYRLLRVVGNDGILLGRRSDAR